MPDVHMIWIEPCECWHAVPVSLMAYWVIKPYPLISIVEISDSKLFGPHFMCRCTI